MVIETKDIGVRGLCLYDMAWESLHPSQSVRLVLWCGISYLFNSIYINNTKHDMSMGCSFLIGITRGVYFCPLVFSFNRLDLLSRFYFI